MLSCGPIDLKLPYERRNFIHMSVNGANFLRIQAPTL